MSNQYVLDTSLARETAAKMDPFTRGYIEAAMWLLTDEDGEPLDYLGLHDIADGTIASVIEECRAFQDAHADLLSQAESRHGDAGHGHDFFLTRNGHGAGFWDRGYPDAIGRALTDAAHAYGSDDWYVGDDGQVYRQ